MNRSWLVALGVLLLFINGRSGAQDRSIRRLVDSKRIALVIGNDDYRASPLFNAVNDAQAMERMLWDLGFDVVARYNTDQRAFDRAVNDFVARLGPKDIALFYYAGHGVQLDTRNYLIPVDFTATDAIEVKYRANPADLVRERMEGSGAALNILILDACRDNPFPATRSFRVGLSQMNSTVGTFIAFSTSPGRTAQDNPGGANGLFTRHLLDALRVPDLSLDEVFNQVRTRVYMESAGRQVPWSSSSVIGDFRFRPHRVAELPSQPPPPMPPSSGTLPPPGETVQPPSETLPPPETSPPAPHSAPRPRPTPPQRTVPGAFVLDTAKPFCIALEKILSACASGFESLIDSKTAGTREYLRPTVILPGAWYAYVQRSDNANNKFLSSFSIGQYHPPHRLTATTSDMIEACLSPKVFGGRKPVANGYRFDVVSSTQCRISVLTKQHDVDVEITANER